MIGAATGLTAIDLFAGAGGLSLGLEQAGFQPIYANEVVDQYAATYALNHPATLIERGDIRQVDVGALRARLRLEPGQLDLIAGGPPCQGYSINAPVRSLTDARNHLFREFLRFVKEFNPKAVLIENVPWLVSFEQGATLNAIIAAVTALGYRCAVRILYAPNFLVPQTRFRAFVIGLADGDPVAAFPMPQVRAPVRVNFTSKFNGRNIVSIPPDGTNLSADFTTVHDAIGDLPALANGQSWDASTGYEQAARNDFQAKMRAGSQALHNHEAMALSAINLERLKHIPPGGNWTDIPAELLPAGMKRARPSDHTKRYGRAQADGLASTILTKCDPHWGAYFHYSQDRAFTVREAARLQTFPDSYVFTGSRVDQYAQVGNAVPPFLSRAIGASLANALTASGACLPMAA